METYKNSYSVKEDEVLWELHEIRHALHQELRGRSLSDINISAREKFAAWKDAEDSTPRGLQMGQVSTSDKYGPAYPQS